MRISLGSAVCVAFALTLAPVVQPAASASWYVSDVTYSYGWDAEVDQDVYYPGTAVVMGHIRRNAGNGYYYAMAEAYGIGAEHVAVVSTDPRDAQGRPLLGHSNLNARIWLSGAPPPPRPATWAQKSYLNGKHCITFDEVQTRAGLDWASGLSQSGLMG